MNPGDAQTIADRLNAFRESFEAVRAEMNKVMVGRQSALEQLLVATLSGGHVLLTGVPGLGRTLLVKTLAKVLGLAYSRVQFTPDLLPSDIVGTEVLEKGPEGERHFRFFKGPVFCNLLLADEINRSPARTQAALLEAMHERQVTIGGQTYWLPKPFTVIATRNNLETDGVWRMPEAQVDRFMVAIELNYPAEEEEIELLRRTTSDVSADVRNVLSPEEVIEMQKFATTVPVVPVIKRFALDIVRASRPETGTSEDAGRDIRLGGSPRAGQSILRGAKVLAVVRGRSYVSSEDVKTMVYPVLAHRIVLDFRASSRGLTVRKMVEKLIRAAEAGRTPQDAYSFNAKHVLKPVVD